tara:strand:- start:1295 stop:1726 length:432 start_codon:yes stop_codon:yes gene_type:complete
MNDKLEDILFPKKKSMGHRDWGSEELLVLISKVLSLKLIKYKKGSKGGLQYHHEKNECGYIVSGQMAVRYDKGDGKLTEKILNKGDWFHFPPKTIHQEEALTDLEIIEASTPHFNDRVRVEEDYGLTSNDGLPSTTEDEVKLK